MHLLYVDDMIITGDDLSSIQELKDFLSQQFEMKDLGHLSYFLDLEIIHSTDGLYITQAKYASELFSRAGLIDSKTVSIPIQFNAHLTPLWGKPLSNSSFYKRLIGNLVYLIATRLEHFLCCLPGEPAFVYSTIDLLCCCTAHSSIPEGHSLS